jgi:adenylate cyclase
VATAIRPAVGDAEQRRVLRKSPDSVSAWEAYQRGLWHLSQGTPDGTSAARRYFQRSAEMDPGFAPAFSGLAFTYVRDSVFHGILPWAEAKTLIEADARKAVALDPNDSEAFAALAHAFMFDDTNASLSYVERALALNRNSAWAHTVKAGAFIYGAGRYNEGREEAQISLRLNPRDPAGPMVASAVAGSYYFEGNYDAAVTSGRRCLAEYPNYDPPRRYLVAALGQLGSRAEAEAALCDFVRIAPKVFDAMVRIRPSYVRPEDHEHMLEGIRKAGWQG